MMKPRALVASLAVRVFAGAVLATLVFALCFGVLSRTWVAWVLHHNLETHAVSIGQGLRSSAVDALATGDLVGLHVLLHSAAESHPHVRYVAVRDGTGKLVAHTLARPPSAEFQKLLQEPRTTPALALRTELGLVHDVALEGRGPGSPTVHVGIGEAWIGETLATLTVLFSAAGAAGLLAGLFVAWNVSRRIVGPLKEIAQAADQIARASAQPGLAGDRVRIPPPCGVTEVDGLARSFADMAASLATANQQLSEAQRQMIRTERMAALGAFVAGTAHAINNPVAGVRACLEMLSAASSDAGRVRRYVTIADEGLTRIHQLVQRLMQYAREGGGVRTRLDLGELVQRSLVVEDVVGRKGHAAQVEVIVPQGPCPVAADPAELEQALTALVVNALQASPPGGVVRVEVSRDGDQGIVLHVDDQGPGVPLPLRGKVFEPFFTTKPEGKGTGLGLWVVWGIVERLGGRVAVASAPLGGARFQVWLPAVRGEPA